MSGVASRPAEGAASDDLVALVYSSTAAEPADGPTLEGILAHSREANGRDDITGMLLYRSGRFIQVLEGDAVIVHALFARIAADARHREVRLLLDEPIERRHFAEWTMGFEPLTRGDASPPPGFRDTFADLESFDDGEAVARAVTELTVWFRTRSGKIALPPNATDSGSPLV